MKTFVTDFEKFIAENFENGDVHLDFVKKVEAFKAKHTTEGEIGAEAKAVLVIEAVKLYEEFFLGKNTTTSVLTHIEPKIPLVVKPGVQIPLQTLLQPPSDPPSDDINANMFYFAELQALRFLYNDIYRIYKSVLSFPLGTQLHLEKTQLDMTPDKRGRKNNWMSSPRTPKNSKSESPPPPPHVLKREMFNIYPEGSPEQVRHALGNSI